MADARGVASKNADKGSTSTRLRVMRSDVKEFLASPRRSHPNPKKQQSPPPHPPPPRKEKEKGKAAAATGEDKVERVQYNCAFQHEDEGSRDFAPPELVWGKVRSHPWWPGQVFDAADASEVALKHRKAGAPLVAYFWDRTFAWSDRSALLPFHANFTRLAAQSTMSSFVSAVDSALQEVGRRVEAGLSCGCFGSSIAIKQEVQNSGVRQGAYGAAVDAVYMRGSFDSEAFLDYISALGKKPLAGADLLELAIAKAQLRAFNRSRGPRDLPEFVMSEGIEEFVEATSHTKRERMQKSSEDDVLSKGKKTRRGVSSSRLKEEALPEAANDEAMHEDSSGGVTHDRLSKGKKAKLTRSSAKKKIGTSGRSNGLETVAIADSRTPANKTVDDILSESKHGRRLRSMSKKEDALEGLKKLGKDGSDELAGNAKDTPLLKDSNTRRSVHKKGRITEDEYGLGDGLKKGFHLQSSHSAKDFTSPGKRRAGHAEYSISKRVPISEHGRKKKKLSELMAETGRPNPASFGKSKSRGKRSLHDLTERAGDPDRDFEDTLKTRKRKKLNTLGDLSSQSEPLSHKKPNKAAGSSVLQAPPAVKANNAVSQTKSHRAKHRQVNATDNSPSPAKVNQGNSEAFSKESLSCGEMLWQLSIAACDLKQREKIAPTSVNFFTDFRKKSNFSCSDANEEIPEKTTDTESAPPEQPIADHMQDDYWADILINVEEPLSSLKRKKDGSKKRASKKAPQVKKLLNNSSVAVENANGPRSEEGKHGAEKGEQLKDEHELSAANGSQPSSGTKCGDEVENSILAGLVLHFNRPGAVPPRSDLIKIFSQYGPVNEAKVEVANSANSAQVIFKRRMDAEAAFAGAGKISALGPALVSFRLTDFPAAASGNGPWPGQRGEGGRESERKKERKKERR
ncbi:hypothetical protein U9M48_016323 [Paspalum notatum var. saurae]|uniref:PWWP domain-containing protein n=1 Tax=Paspalum notatum var. saurae TaxID=547442 RepID=A0AAQ3WMQ2_PASNO